MKKAYSNVVMSEKETTLADIKRLPGGKQVVAEIAKKLTTERFSFLRENTNHAYVFRVTNSSGQWYAMMWYKDGGKQAAIISTVMSADGAAASHMYVDENMRIRKRPSAKAAAPKKVKKSGASAKILVCCPHCRKTCKVSITKS